MTLNLKDLPRRPLLEINIVLITEESLNNLQNMTQLHKTRVCSQNKLLSVTKFAMLLQTLYFSISNFSLITFKIHS